MSEQQNDEKLDQRKQRSSLILRIVITLSALALAAFHLMRPNVRFDGIGLILVLLAVFPWLGMLLSEFEIGPSGLKARFRELETRVTKAEGTALDAQAAAQSADRKAEFNLVVGPAVVGSAVDAALVGEPWSEAVKRLADEYEHIRQTQRPGGARTANMTAIVRKMLDLGVSVDEEEVRLELDNERAGMRLNAYAQLYVSPRVELLDDLVKSLTEREDKPFGQYWGLQALRRVMESAEGTDIDSQLIASTQKRLESFRGRYRIERGTDRYYELVRIVEMLKARLGTTG